MGISLIRIRIVEKNVVEFPKNYQIYGFWAESFFRHKSRDSYENFSKLQQMLEYVERNRLRPYLAKSVQ